MLVIDAHHLTKTFAAGRWWRGPRRVVVDDVDLSIQQGTIHALLGPNGAGKSTLVRLLCGLLTADSGSAEVAGVPISDGRGLRRVVGLVSGGERGLYPRLTGREHLEFFAALRGLRGVAQAGRVRETLAMVELQDAASRPTQTYSTGMRQRLAIATALLHRPPVLFLDEPTRSLDPIAREDLYDVLRQLAASGVTILLVTHDLMEAELLSNAMTIMAHGRVVGGAAAGFHDATTWAGDPTALVRLYRTLVEGI